MAPRAPQTFKGITPEKYALLTGKAKGAGLEMEGNNGVASKFGVEIQWSYTPETEELTLQCLRHPFFVSAEDVDTKMRDLVRQTLATGDLQAGDLQAGDLMATPRPATPRSGELTGENFPIWRCPGRRRPGPVSCRASIFRSGARRPATPRSGELQVGIFRSGGPRAGDYRCNTLWSSIAG